jgi:hypothetical protein
MVATAVISLSEASVCQDFTVQLALLNQLHVLKGTIVVILVCHLHKQNAHLDITVSEEQQRQIQLMEPQEMYVLKADSVLKEHITLTLVL